MKVSRLAAGPSGGFRIPWLGRIGVVSVILAMVVAVTTGTAGATARPGASRTAHRSALAAVPAASGSQFDSTFFGVNDAYNGASAFQNDAGYNNQLSQLGPLTLRWPGGTGADYFEWRLGYPTNGSDRFDFTLEELFAHYQATGKHAAPIFDLNVLDMANRTDPTDQIQMLQHAQSIGLPIDYVEIGNELYFQGTSSDFANAFHTGTDYGNTVAIYVKALHQAFPGVQVTAAASLHSNTGDPRQDNWNALMMAAARGAGWPPDAVTLHTYPGPNIDHFTGSQDQLNTLFEGTYQAITDLDHAAQSTALAGVPIWIDEYNMTQAVKQGPTPEQRTYSHELYNAALAMMLPRVDDAAHVDTWEAFAQTVNFGAWSDPTNPTLTPGGQAVKFVDRVAHLRGSTEAITFPGAPTLPSGEPEVFGQAFTAAGSAPHSVLVNLSSSAQHVAVGGDVPSGVAYKQVTGTPSALLDVAPTPTTGTVGAGGATTLNLPAFSVTQIGDCSC